MCAQRVSNIERWGVFGILIAYFVLGYFVISPHVKFVQPIDLSMGLDHRIPFNPVLGWLYIWALPAAAMPGFVVRSEHLFRLTAFAYFLVMTVSILVFGALPETAIAFRPSTTILDLAQPSQWLVANIYAIDPPGNLFPSLHISLTALSAFAAWKSSKLLGLVAFTGLCCVAMAACAVKQHFLVDVFGGLALAGFVAALTINRCRDEGHWTIGEGLRTVGMYFLLILSFYAAIGGAYCMGFASLVHHALPGPTSPPVLSMEPTGSGALDPAQSLRFARRILGLL